MTMSDNKKLEKIMILDTRGKLSTFRHFSVDKKLLENAVDGELGT